MKCLSKLVLASSNTGKILEFQNLLAPFALEVIPQRSLGIEAPPEPYPSFVENALTKARSASKIAGLAALADDSGICVPVLGGAPGVQSARYAGEPRSDDANNAKLVQALSSHTDKSAYYYCVLVFVRHAEDPQPVIAEGCWQGELITKPRGEGGFGYDPHFLLPALGKTAAELSAEQKNELSHRGQALRALMAKLS